MSTMDMNCEDDSLTCAWKNIQTVETVLEDAKSYTDTALGEAKSYADQKSDAALEDAKSYADERTKDSKISGYETRIRGDHSKVAINRTMPNTCLEDVVYVNRGYIKLKCIKARYGGDNCYHREYLIRGDITHFTAASDYTEYQANLARDFDVVIQYPNHAYNSPIYVAGTQSVPDDISNIVSVKWIPQKKDPSLLNMHITIDVLGDGDPNDPDTWIDPVFMEWIDRWGVAILLERYASNGEYHDNWYKNFPYIYRTRDSDGESRLVFSKTFRFLKNRKKISASDIEYIEVSVSEDQPQYATYMYGNKLDPQSPPRCKVSVLRKKSRKSANAPSENKAHIFPVWHSIVGLCLTERDGWNQINYPPRYGLVNIYRGNHLYNYLGYVYGEDPNYIPDEGQRKGDILYLWGYWRPIKIEIRSFKQDPIYAYGKLIFDYSKREFRIIVKPNGPSMI